jgi:hypothetical protein
MENVDGLGCIRVASEAAMKSLFVVDPPCGEWLSARQFEGERWILDQMPEDHVPPATGQADTREIIGDGLLGETVDEPFERLDGIEDLRVPRRISTRSFDHVRPVPAVLTDGVQERLSFGQGVLKSVLELVYGLDRDRNGLVTDGDGDCLPRPFDRQSSRVTVRFCGPCVLVLGWSIRRAGEFLDQPRRRDFLYPPSSGGQHVTTCHFSLVERD